AGNMVPADIRLLKVTGLQVNESALTGESVPISKTAKVVDTSEQINMAFMGTAVTTGEAIGVVVGTGQATSIGSIAETMRSSSDVKTPLQERIGRLAWRVALAILVVAGLSFGLGLYLGRPADEMFLLAVALAVSAMPEGLPIMVTVALAVGVKRMAERHALIRHLPAVETLGSTTVIVSDK